MGARGPEFKSRRTHYRRRTRPAAGRLRRSSSVRPLAVGRLYASQALEPPDRVAGKMKCQLAAGMRVGRLVFNMLGYDVIIAQLTWGPGCSPRTHLTTIEG